MHMCADADTDIGSPLDGFGIGDLIDGNDDAPSPVHDDVDETSRATSVGSFETPPRRTTYATHAATEGAIRLDLARAPPVSSHHSRSTSA